MEELNFSIALIALLLSGFVSYWQFLRKPNIEISYEDSEPFRKLLHIEERQDKLDFEWFIRIRVKNNSRRLAKNCFGKIVEWYTNSDIVTEFDPIKLHWVSNPPGDYANLDLAYKEYDYIDVFFTDKNFSKIKIYTHTHARGVPLEFDLLSNHAVKLVVYSENESHNFFYLKVWYEKEDSGQKLRFPRVACIGKREFEKLISAPKQ
jgi:hypothetical protein